MKKALQWMFANRKKEAHYLVAFVTAVGTMWATSAGFRGAVTHEMALMPHWVQGLAAVLAFAAPIWKLAKEALAESAQ